MRKLQSVALALFCLTLVALICGASSATGQEITATISGTVTDQSGAAIAGATVIAKSVARGVPYVAETNEAGLYRISNLPVGSYDLKVEKPGFQTSLVAAFVLVLNQVARIDVQMKVGQVSETIEVTGAVPALKTETTQVDTIIDSATNEALPLATRNYVQLTLLSPGAIHPDPSTFNNGDNVAAGARPFINGNREQSNNFLLDGMDNNEVSDNLLGYTPSPDSIQEFNLITNNAPAEFGNFQGGVVSATLKSGTNSFHGDIWEFFRNDVLNANEWGNKINPASPASARPPLRWNMFGGTLGGPVIKNKLFFFVDYQGQRFDHPATVAQPGGGSGLFSVFTPAEQGGNFGALCSHGFDPTGTCLDRAGTKATPSNYTCGVGDNTNGCVVANQLYNPCAAGTGVSGVPCAPSAAANAVRPAFPNNQIPVGMISPVAAALFASSLYPKTVNNGLTANAVNIFTQQFNADQGDIKVDYSISDKDRVSGRFTRSFQNDPSQNSQVLFGSGFTTAPIWSTVGDWTRSISSNLVNDMRFGWNHVILNTGTSWNPSVGNFGQSIGIANSNPGLTGLLNLAFGGGTPTSPTCGTINCIGNSMVTQSFNSQVYQFDDGITWTHGRHSFKFGGQYWFDIIKVFYSGNSGELGGMTFGANFTASSATCTNNSTTANCSATSPFAGNGMGDFFLGLPTSFGRGLTSGPSSTWTQTTNVYAGYVQDTWRYSAHLTLNAGLRYEVHTPWIERNDRQDNYNTVTQQIQYANQGGASRSLYNGVYGAKDLQPRLGFAWTPGWSGGKTVVRGAFTISSYLEGTGTNLRLPINPPFSPAEFQSLYTSQALPGSTASDGIIAPASSGGTSCPNYSCFQGALLRIWDPNVQPAISDQWNLTVQRQFGAETTLQVSYVGQRGTHLMVPFDYAQPVSLPSTACAKPPCTGPSPFFANNPTLAGIASDQASGTQSNGTMDYNALQAVLQKNMGGGLQYQVAYTFSKCMSNNTGYYGTWSTYKQSSTASPYWQNIYNPQSEWSPCYYDSTHVLSGYAIYELPFGKGKKFGGNMNKAADAVVGGWTVSPILSWHTGFPLALYNNGTDHTGTDSRGLRPDCNGTNTVFGRRNFTGSGGGILWFDPSNYSNAAGFGTCAPQMAQLRGPGFYNWDISIQKNVQLTERFKLQFRGDLLNTFNHVNLCAPNTTVAQSTTGQITCAQPAREVQFALKLYY